MSAADLYREMCSYLEACGWRREEPGSVWWCDSQGAERTIGDAVDVRADP